MFQEIKADKLRRAAALKQAGVTATETRHFAKAIEQLNAAAGLDPHDEEIPHLVADAQTLMEARQARLTKARHWLSTSKVSNSKIKSSGKVVCGRNNSIT